ncbi:MAG: glycosyltransferase family 2 protein [Candidatus Ratteibacteria bacterium]|nr:glycosyltransferase family 2 protein [Candidatus Ratteibacteria bacterium]
MFSVIICTYSVQRYSDLIEAIDSVKNQTYPFIEIIVVVDGNKELYDTILSQDIGVKMHLNDINLGLSKSRNVGAEIATGDVVAFLDDDAVADPYWISHLAILYRQNDAVAAGGRLVPLWIDGVSAFIPEEFWWLIGANPKGSPEHIKIVRNTYGSNISFARDVFLRVGGFDTGFGFNAGKNTVLQGEEADICNRIQELTGAGVWYNPDAIVHHKVFKSRVALKALFRRAFWQGYSKHVMGEKSSDKLSQESGFLKYVLFTGIPERIIQLFFLVAFTATVGLGYIYRIIDWRIENE